MSRKPANIALGRIWLASKINLEERKATSHPVVLTGISGYVFYILLKRTWRLMRLIPGQLPFRESCHRPKDSLRSLPEVSGVSPVSQLAIPHGCLLLSSFPGPPFLPLLYVVPRARFLSRFSWFMLSTRGPVMRKCP